MKKLKNIFDKLFFGLFGYSYPKEDYLKKIDDVKVIKQEPKVYSIENTVKIKSSISKKPKVKRKVSTRKKKTSTSVL